MADKALNPGLPDFRVSSSLVSTTVPLLLGLKWGQKMEEYSPSEMLQVLNPPGA